MLKRILAISLCISMLFTTVLPVTAVDSAAADVYITGAVTLDLAACNLCRVSGGHAADCPYNTSASEEEPIPEEVPADTTETAEPAEETVEFAEPQAAATEPVVSTMALGQELTITSGELASGTYHLTKNYTLTGALTIPTGNTVVLDLNGFVLQGAGLSENFVISSSGNLTIVDSRPTIGHRGTLDTNGAFVFDGTGPIVIYGGIITNKGKGKCVLVSENTTTIQGGTIAGGYGYYGSAVTISSSGTLVMQKDPSTGTTPQVMYNRSVVRTNGETNIGGAIWGEQAYSNAGSYISISNTTISHNISDSNGGAICGYNMTITDSVITDNTVNTGFGGGVNVRGSGAVVSISNTQITGNSAEGHGGGICFATSGTLLLSNGSKIDGNTSGYYGGGIYMAGSSKATISDSTIDNNEARLSAGGLFFQAEAQCTLTNVSISGNTSVAGNAGGVFVYGNSSFIGTNVTISNNSILSDEHQTGGLYISNNSTLELTGSTISGNQATGNGGGITVGNDATVKLKGCTISGNASTIAHGGGFYGGTNINLTISDQTVFSGNTAAATGGGLLLESGGTVSISDTTFSGNTAADSAGGALIAENASVTLTNVTFRGNKSTTGHAGGILIKNSTTAVNMTSCVFDANSAGLDGGGIYLYSTADTPSSMDLKSVTMTNNVSGNYGGAIALCEAATVTTDAACSFTGNSATLYGGAIYAQNSVVFTATGSIFTQNTAGSHGGALMFWHYGTVTLTDAQITDNQTNNVGGGIFMGRSTTLPDGSRTGLTMTRCDLSHNKTANTGGGLMSYGDVTISDTTVTYNDCISPNSGRGGGLSVEQSDADGIGASAHLDMTNVAIEHNRATFYGAGVQVSGAAATARLNSGSISHNTCIIYGATAVHVTSAAKFTLVDGTLAYNKANYVGGAIHASYGCELNLLGGTIEYNEVVGRGGGLHADVGCTINLQNTVIAHNKALSGDRPLHSGIVLDSETGEITSATYEHIEGYGGGILIDSAEFKMESGTVCDNYAEAGGGGIGLVMILTSKEHLNENKVVKFEITGGTVENNSTDGNGGGVYLMENKLDDMQLEGTSEELLTGIPMFIASGGIIRGNTAKGNGGAAYLDTDTEFHFSGTAIMENNHAHGSGGAVYISLGTANVTGGTILNNSADLNGGAIYVHGNINVTGGTIGSNSAVDGGAVYVTDGHFYMTGGTIGGSAAAANTASNDGGAVYVTTGNFTIASGTMSYNTAGNRGGAVHANGGIITVGVQGCTGEDDTLHADMPGKTHPTISHNQAVYGGGISVSKTVANDGETEVGGTVYMYCGTVTDNKAENEGLGDNVYMDGGVFDYYNGTIGVTDNPGIVVVGGELNDHHDYDDKYPINYYANFHIGDTEGEVHTAQAALGQYINLPDGTAYWDREPNFYFVGWTTYVSGNMSADAHYVRSRDDYKAIGMAVNIKSQIDGTVDFYALWAPATSSIQYQYFLNNVDGTLDGGYLTTTNDTSYPYTKRTNDTTVLHLTSPEKEGYTFKGWILVAGEAQNTNWGSDPSVDANGNTDYSQCTYLAVSDPAAGYDLQYGTCFGDITLIADFVENTVTLQYRITGPSGTSFGSVDVLNETVGAAAGLPEGSTATPAAGFKVVGWYTNAACTAAVPEAWLTVGEDGSVKLIPQKDADALWINETTFFAKFDYAIADLTIEIDGIDTNTNQSYLFTVYGEPFDNSAPFTMTVAITCNTDNYGKVILKSLPVGEYTVTEQTQWSWRYDLASQAKDITVDGTDVHKVSFGESEFTRLTDQWLNFFSWLIQKTSSN